MAAEKKRTKNYIDNSVQGALLRRIFSHWVMFFVVAGFAIVLLKTLMGDANVSVSERLRFQAGEFVFLAIVMLALLPVFMLDAIRFSNRFVGPTSRLRRHLRQLSAGDTAKCEFRGADFWKGMATEFNSVAELVEKQQVEIERLKLVAKETEAQATSS